MPPPGPSLLPALFALEHKNLHEQPWITYSRHRIYPTILLTEYLIPSIWSYRTSIQSAQPRSWVVEGIREDAGRWWCEHGLLQWKVCGRMVSGQVLQFSSGSYSQPRSETTYRNSTLPFLIILEFYHLRCETNSPICQYRIPSTKTPTLNPNKTPFVPREMKPVYGCLIARGKSDRPSTTATAAAPGTSSTRTEQTGPMHFHCGGRKATTTGQRSGRV